MIDPALERPLIEAAQRSLEHAYIPVSGFAVGAAVLTATGQVYGGCNVESVISGLGVCAERCAIDHAVACGEYRYRAIAIVSRKPEPLAPCGMCQQYIGEFSQVGASDIAIIMAGANGRIERSSIRTMARSIFGPADLGLDLSRYRR